MDTKSNVMVSIIMNCYNSERFLKEAIDSIYAQDFNNWEIIFWDNRSTDSSAEIAKSYDSRLKYYLADKHTVLGAARNSALSKAKGKYIAFLDCDDSYLPNKLRIQVNLMENYRFALSYGSAIIMDESGTEIRRESVSYKSGDVFSNLLDRYEINMQSVMIRREILQKEKLNFDKTMKYCPDYKLFMEISSKFKVGVLQKFVVKYRLTSNSLSKKTIDIASSEVKYALNDIFNNSPKLKKMYPKQVRLAYGKLHYYDAIVALTNNHRITAIRYIGKIKYQRWQYFFLYIVLFSPISDSLILRLLRR